MGALTSDKSVPGYGLTSNYYGSGYYKALTSDSTNGWKHDHAYKYHIQHRPSQDLIHVKLWEEGALLFDTGDVYDNVTTSESLRGGKLGVFCMSQENITWSALSYGCGYN